MKSGALFSASIFSAVFTWSAATAKPLARLSLRQSPPTAVHLHAEKAARESTEEEVAAKADLQLVESSVATVKWKPPPPKTPWKEMPTEIHAKEPGSGYPEGSLPSAAQQGLEANITQADETEESELSKELPKNIDEAMSISFWHKYRHAHLFALTAYPMVYFIFWMLVGLIYTKFIQHRGDGSMFAKQAEVSLEEVVQEARRIFANLDKSKQGIVAKAKLLDALKSSPRLVEMIVSTTKDDEQQRQVLDSVFQGMERDLAALDSNKYMFEKDLDQWVRANCVNSPFSTRTLAKVPSRPGDRKAFEFGLLHCSKQALPICLCSWFCLPIRWAETISSVPKPDYLAPSRPQYGLHTFWTALCIFTVPIAVCGLSSGFGLMLFLILAVYYRQTLRALYGLENYTCRSCCTDALLWTCCGCCAAAQEAMQVSYAPQPSSSWRAGLASYVPGFVPGALLMTIVLSFVFL
mmetsp:Transcript_82075/g.135650  ORF Transcript_82075/g.135650 Transcript_82075/m.135650 type:complete len:465 (+) Transcript_82075:131-1525(+)